MEPRCDNTSVGVIIENDCDEILLIERAKFPTGFAPPAGHIDDHGNSVEAAVAEVYEETGLVIATHGLKIVIDSQRMDMACRRQNGNFHYWTVLISHSYQGEVTPNVDETKGANWYSREMINSLDKENELELVWSYFFKQLGYI